MSLNLCHCHRDGVSGIKRGPCPPLMHLCTVEQEIIFATGDYKLGTTSTINLKNTILIHGKIKCNIHSQRMLSLNDGHISKFVTQCYLLCIILPPPYGFYFIFCIINIYSSVFCSVTPCTFTRIRGGTTPTPFFIVTAVTNSIFHQIFAFQPPFL